MTTPPPHNGSSALIIGGGVIGLSSAIALALRGIAVTLLERGNVGEFAASRRAAGILGAQLELHATAAMQDLCLLSRSHYPAWIETLSALSGQPIEFSPAGAMRVAFDATDPSEESQLPI